MFTRTNSTSGIKSPLKIIANVFISFIGAGMLGLPYAFKESGILEGVLILCTVGFLSVKAMLMIIECKYKILSAGREAQGYSAISEAQSPLMASDSLDNESLKSFCDITYGDIGYHAFGKRGKQLVDTSIIFSQVGFCCGYLIFLSETLTSYMHVLTKEQWLAILLLPLFVLTLLRHLNKLAVFSIFAQFSNILALLVVFWFDFSHSEEIPFHPKEVSLKGMPFFFAVAIYCFEGAGMILSLEESVARNMRDVFKSLFVSTMFALTGLYVIFGASGYLSFGPHTKELITKNLPHGNGTFEFAAVVKVCLGISLFFTYPLMMFPVTHLLDRALDIESSYIKANMLRLFLVSVTGVVVVAVPNFATLTGLIGATCCTLLAFILPAAFHLSLFKKCLTRNQMYFNVLLIFIGCLGSGVGMLDVFGRIKEHLMSARSQVPIQAGLYETALVHKAPFPLLNKSSIVTHDILEDQLKQVAHSLQEAQMPSKSVKISDSMVTRTGITLVTKSDSDKNSDLFGAKETFINAEHNAVGSTDEIETAGNMAKFVQGSGPPVGHLNSPLLLQSRPSELMHR